MYAALRGNSIFAQEGHEIKSLEELFPFKERLLYKRKRKVEEK